MPSIVDVTKPIYGSPTTASVRQNFAILGEEVSALQALMAPGPFLPKSGGEVTGPIYLANDPTDPRMPATKAYVDAGGGGGGGGIPEAPADGALYARQDGSWKKALPIIGGILTGLLTLSADPTNPLHAATKQYTDEKLGSYLPLEGGTLTGGLNVINGNVVVGANTTATPDLKLNGSTSSGRYLSYQTAGLFRWRTYVDGIAESGSNVGSDYRIDRYNDAGAFVGNALVIARSNGAITFSGTLTSLGIIIQGSNTATSSEIRINGAAASSRMFTYQTAGVVRWRTYVDNVAEAGSNAGSNFCINRYDDAGIALGQSIIINRATSLTSLNGRVLVNNIADNGTAGLQVSGDFIVGAGSAFITNPTSPPAILTLTGTGTNGAGIKLTGNGATTPSKYLQAYNGGFRIVNDAYTSAIFSLSDAGAISIPGSFASFGNVTVGTNTTVSPLIIINGVANNEKSIIFYSASAARWLFSTSNSLGAESGGNTGGDLIFGRYNDAGAYISTALSINRATGNITASGVITAPTHAAGSNAAVYPTVSLNGVHNTDRQLLFMSNGLNRWIIVASGVGGETGGNAGSDLAIGRFSDAQSYLGTPISISRATGLVSIGSGMTVTGGNLLVGGNGTISTGGQLLAGFVTVGQTGASQGGFVGSWNPSNNDYQGIWSNTGLLYFGHANLSGTPQVGYATLDKSSNFLTNGRVTGAIGVFCGAAAQFGMSQDATFQYDNWTSVWQNRFVSATGVRQWTDFNYTALMTLGPSGLFTVANSAYKPGGGAWADSSDARIKDVRGDYTRGLNEIIQLQPRIFQYLGNEKIISAEPRLRDAPEDAGEPEPHSPHAHATDKDFVGLIAQEMEALFPEMVTQVAAIIDDETVNDLRILDTTPLIFALVNATRELHARVLRLEGTA